MPRFDTRQEHVVLTVVYTHNFEVRLIIVKTRTGFMLVTSVHDKQSFS